MRQGQTLAASQSPNPLVQPIRSRREKPLKSGSVRVGGSPQLDSHRPLKHNTGHRGPFLTGKKGLFKQIMGSESAAAQGE